MSFADFIIVNYTNRYICGVEVKRSLSEAKILKSGHSATLKNHSELGLVRLPKKLILGTS